MSDNEKKRNEAIKKITEAVAGLNTGDGIAALELVKFALVENAKNQILSERREEKSCSEK